LIAAQVYAFVFAMWILILVGGGLVVTFVGPISFSGYGDMDPLLNSSTKAAIAILLIAIWITILSKVKNWIFHKQIKR